MTKNTHSIQRVFLEIDTPSMVTADAIKNNLAVFLQNELFPLLEKQFNTIQNTDNQIIQIEKLQISIQSDTEKKDTFLSDNESKNDIKNRIEKEVQKALIDLQKTTKKETRNESEWKTISAHDKQIKTLLHFIENGSMPWWVTQKEEEIFLKKTDFSTFQNTVFSVPFRQLIRQKKVQKRLINQFSNEEIVLLGVAFLSKEVNPKTISQNSFFKVLHSQSHLFKASFWHSIFEIWTNQKYAGLIPFYTENQSFFTSKGLSFELFIQSIKIVFPSDFNIEELIQKHTVSFISEQEKPIVKPTVSKNDQETSLSEEKPTHPDILKKENNSEPAFEINSLKKEIKEQPNSDENGSELRAEIYSIKDKVTPVEEGKNAQRSKTAEKDPTHSERNVAEENSSEVSIESESFKEQFQNKDKEKDPEQTKPEEKELANSEKNTPELTIENDPAKSQSIPKKEEEKKSKPEEKDPKNPNEDVSDLPDEIYPVEDPSVNTTLEEEDDFQEDSTGSKSCYVQNAGLIILHPFLNEMLKNCGLMDDNHTLLDKERAAHILHYAATKRENDYEHAMLFEKFLCGIPLRQSIPREVKISDKHKQQVEEMLDSAVQHWSALKNTSTAVLRTEFLQREGKLDWSESNPKLTIERKTQDLLLEKIPWNISIVKIPWIDKLIYTQW